MNVLLVFSVYVLTYTTDEITGIQFDIRHAFSNGTPCIIPGNTEVHDLVTPGRVIWVIDTIRTRLAVRAHTLTRADCIGSQEQGLTNVGQKSFITLSFRE